MSHAAANMIDKLCDDFESQLAKGVPVRAEQYLSHVAEEDRRALLPELIGLELDYRRQDGLHALREEFRQRFPNDPFVESMLRTSAGQTREVADDDTIGDRTQQSGRRSIADYEIIREIARGGMGVVYEARQATIGRKVALKCILSSQLASMEALQRFHNEARAAASLDHPHIVPVYDVGEADGELYFSMALVNGESLADRLSNLGPLPALDAARLLVRIGEGVEHAHQAGVVHRDLKPANILIEAEDVPRITDFGLAKLTGDATREASAAEALTVTGQVIGTPSYMSPEQARGDQASVGKLADVYALGAILYATLTGRPPFQAATVPATVRQVLEQEPLHPRALDRSLPLDLCTISLKALDKNPARRYATAGEFTADVRRFLQHRPILARRASTWERTVRWTRRNRALAACIIAMLATIGVLASGSWLVNRQRMAAVANSEAARTQRRLADENFQLAMSAVDEYLTKVGDDTLLNEPGMEPLRKKLLTAASGFYADIVSQSAGKDESASLLVDAMLKQALIVEATERKETAIEHFQRIIAKIHDVGDLDQSEWLQKLVRTQTSLADAQTAIGQFEAARETIESTRERFEQAKALEPDSLELTLLESRALGALGNYWDRKGDLEKCREISEENGRLLAAVAAQHAPNWPLLNRQARAAGGLGVVWLKQGEHETAHAKFEEAQAFCEKAIGLQPDNTNARWLRAAMLKLQGQSLSQNADYQPAQAAYAAAVGALEDITRDFPMATRFQKELAAAYMGYGTNVMDAGDVRAGLQIIEQGLAVWQDLVAQFPRADFKKRLAITHTSVAHGYKRLKDLTQAEWHSLAAIELATALATVPDPEPRNVSDLGHMRSQLGNIYMDAAREREALPQFLSAWNLMREYAPAHRELIDVVYSYTAAAHGLANCYRQTGEEQQAIDIYQAARPLLLETWQSGRRGRLGNYLHSNYLGQGRAFYQLGDLDQAASAFSEAERFAATQRRTLVAQFHQWMLAAEQGEYEAQFEHASLLVEQEASELHYKAAAYVAGACCNGVSNDPQGSPDERRQLVDQYQAQCLDWLEQLQADDGLSTHFERKALTLSPAFATLRDHPRFIALLKP